MFESTVAIGTDLSMLEKSYLENRKRFKLKESNRTTFPNTVLL